jgi:RNA polymerase sigma-70 factor (TIGR02957 family)
MDVTDAQNRSFLFALAYRMTGSVAEAEDLVQEAFLRLHRARDRGEDIQSPRAFLATVVTRLAIDYLRSARTRREQYVGDWLPEPVLADPGPGPEERAELADSLSMAFGVVLETLTPLERAVFLLREVFDYSYAEVADVVGRSEENCRQIALRARTHVAARRPRFDPPSEERDTLARRFFEALQDGDMVALERMLAEDVVLQGDGGGKAPAIARALHGRDRVARFLVNLSKQGRRAGFWLDAAVVNGQPGAVGRTADGLIVNVFSIDVTDGRIAAVRSVVNPDKLHHIGPVADVAAMLRSRRANAADN